MITEGNSHMEQLTLQVRHIADEVQKQSLSIAELVTTFKMWGPVWERSAAEAVNINNRLTSHAEYITNNAKDVTEHKREQNERRADDAKRTDERLAAMTAELSRHCDDQRREREADIVGRRWMSVLLTTIVLTMLGLAAKGLLLK